MSAALHIACQCLTAALRVYRELRDVLIHLHLLCAGLLGRELNNNALHGPIPEALWHLMQLEKLYLYSNQLTSTISSSMATSRS